MKGFRHPIVLIVLFMLSLSVVAAPPDSANVYDKFRNHHYDNKGLMTESQELQLAAELHQQILQEAKLVTDPRITEYVNRVGQTVAEKSRRPELNYQFYIINSDEINAFTTGGGRVYIYSGILRRLNTEGELAAVLAHEIGHNVGRHVLQQIRSSQRWSKLVLAGAVLGGYGGANLGAMLAEGKIFKHSREAEREADFLGLYNIRDAGYNVEEMDKLFQILETIEQGQPTTINKTYASHPPALERYHNTEVEIKQHLSADVAKGVHSTPDFDRTLALLGSPRNGRQNRPNSNGTGAGDAQGRVVVPQNPSQDQSPSGPKPPVLKRGGSTRTQDTDTTSGQTSGQTGSQSSENASQTGVGESVDPGARNSPDAENIPFLTDAQAALRRSRVAGAQVLATARGDAFGDGHAGLLVIYKYNDQYRALITRDGEDYLLRVGGGELDLPIHSYLSAQFTNSLQPAVFIVANELKMRWLWNGADFDYFNVR